MCSLVREYNLEWQADGVTVHRGAPPEDAPLVNGPFADMVSLVLDCLHAEGFTMVTTEGRPESMPLSDETFQKEDQSPAVAEDPSPAVAEDMPF